MVKKKIDNRLYLLFGFSVFFFLCAIFSSFILFEDGLLSLTGRVTGSGTVTLTQAGAAGLFLSDSSVSFGSGYLNVSGDCAGLFAANLDSNNSAGLNVNLKNFPLCWINTTEFLSGSYVDSFNISNNGTVNVNVSAIADKDGEDWLCGGNCSFTNLAALSLLSINQEASSCTGLTEGYESLIGPATNVTVGLCNNLDYSDSSDSIAIYVNTTIPKDTTSGAKTLTITFQALVT